MKMAERFNIPVVCLIDTPGAYPALKLKKEDKPKPLPETYLKWRS